MKPIIQNLFSKYNSNVVVEGGRDSARVLAHSIILESYMRVAAHHIFAMNLMYLSLNRRVVGSYKTKRRLKGFIV